MRALAHERKRRWDWAPAVAVVLAVILVAPAVVASGCGSSAKQDSPVTTIAPGVDGRQVGAATATTAAAASMAPVSGEAAPSSAGSAATPSDQIGVEPIANLTLAQANLDRKVVQNATLQIEVKRDTFQRQFDAALALADTYGGYVVSSTSQAQADEAVVRSGTITLRVPSASFDQALKAASALGVVKARQIDSQDVTQEYVDLKAQLTNTQAEALAMQNLLAQAKTVDDILRVRSVLTGLQQEIEQLKGRIQYLDEHTSYSTLTLNMYEAGTVVATTTSGNWGFAQALSDALHNFVNSINSLIAWLGGALPGLALLALVSWAGYRVVRSTLRKRGGDSGAKAS